MKDKLFKQIINLDQKLCEFKIKENRDDFKFYILYVKKIKWLPWWVFNRRFSALISWMKVLTEDCEVEILDSTENEVCKFNQQQSKQIFDFANQIIQSHKNKKVIKLAKTMKK